MASQTSKAIEATPPGAGWRDLTKPQARHEELARINSFRAIEYIYGRVSSIRFAPNSIYPDNAHWHDVSRDEWPDRPDWPHVQWCTIQWAIFPDRGTAAVNDDD